MEEPVAAPRVYVHDGLGFGTFGCSTHCRSVFSGAPLNEILLPALGTILPKFPAIHVEVIIGYGLTNIVAQQVDAGIRPGELVAKDMIAVRVSPDLRMAVVGSPSIIQKTLIARPASPENP